MSLMFAVIALSVSAFGIAFGDGSASGETTWLVDEKLRYAPAKATDKARHPHPAFFAWSGCAALTSLLRSAALSCSLTFLIADELPQIDLQWQILPCLTP